MLFGIAHGLQWESAELLAGLTAAETHTELVVALYPACSTRQEVLLELLRLSVDRRGLDVRLLLTNLWTAAPGSILYAGPRTGAGHLIVGPSPNLGLSAPDPCQLNLVIPGTPLLLDEWRRTFNYIWSTAIPLTEETARIPSLVPARGSEDGERLWREFQQACEAACEAGTAGAREVVHVDPKTGEVEVRDTAGRPLPSVDETLRVSRVDPVAQEMVRLFARGNLVTIDKATRLPPLDAPVRAEWFGLQSSRQHGVVSREVSYRISALDARTQKTVENCRKGVRGLLDRFTFPLADGARWMPVDALPLFEEEMERLNSEGAGALNAALGGNPALFLQARRQIIAADANRMYQELFPAQTLSEHTINDILTELAKRLTAAQGVQLLPKLTLSPVTFDPSTASRWQSSWGQALSLLRAIAEYPRKLLTDSYFLRGLKVDPEALLAAMNVCGDAIVAHMQTSRWSVESEAKRQLEIIQEIIESSAPERGKCAALLGLMHGDEWRDIQQELAPVVDILPEFRKEFGDWLRPDLTVARLRQCNGRVELETVFRDSAGADRHQCEDLEFIISGSDKPFFPLIVPCLRTPTGLFTHSTPTLSLNAWSYSPRRPLRRSVTLIRVQLPFAHVQGPGKGLRPSGGGPRQS